MHSVYSFLIDNLDSDPNAADKDLQDAAVGILERYFDHNGDENNGYEPLVLILPSGRFVPIVEKGDWRGRDEWVPLVQKVNPAKRWDWAMTFALQCVAIDAELWRAASIHLGQPDPGGDKINKATRDELIAEIYKQVPARLVEMLQVFNPQTDMLDAYRINKLARLLDLFHGAKPKPFAQADTPYVYRAYDLREDGWDEKIKKDCGIVLADVHT